MDYFRLVGCLLVVAKDARGRCELDRQQIVTQRLELALAEAVSSGLDEAKLRSMLESALQGALVNQEAKAE